MRKLNYATPTFACLLVVLAACASHGDQAAGQTARYVDIVDRRVWFEAAEQGNTGLVLALLDDGIDPAIEREGLTALHVAARDGHAETVDVLLAAGLDVNLGPDYNEAQLASAAGHGSATMLELITGSKLDPYEVARALNIRTPLNLAVEAGHADVARTLIAHGADIEAGGEWYSPLHSAVMTGDIEIVELLLENDASVGSMIRVQDRSKFSGFRYVTPLELARIVEREDIASLLRDYGAR